MNDSKNKKLEDLAFEIITDTNKISENNIYKQMMESSKNQIYENQHRLNEKKLVLRIFSDLKSGTIELNTLNAVTSGLQNIFTSAYNNIFGNGKDRGKIPGWITDSSSLVLTGVGKGSFIVELENINEINEKPEQIDLIQDNEQKNEIITNLLTFLNEEDESGIENIIKEYGVRTFNISKGWFKNMEQNKVSFEYKDSYNNKTERFNSNQIKNISDRLSNVKVSKREEVLEINSTLTGMRNSTRTLILELDTGEEIEVKVSDKSLDKYEVISNKKYDLKINKIIITDTIGKQILNYQIDTIEGTDLTK